MVELHVVSGKGGVGKTTVAAGLALALAAHGRRCLLVEVEGRQGIAQLFDTAPLPYAEVPIAVAPEGGEVIGLAVDPEGAFYEYLDLFYRLGPAGRILRKAGAVDFAATVAPGLRDVLLTGKVYESVGRRREGRIEYDAVVLDAPPTGRLTRFLNVGTEVSGLAKVGPVRAQADAINSLIRSDRTVIHLVTLLEEMPVQETVDAVAECRASGLPLGAIVVNDVTRSPFSASTMALLGLGGAAESPDTATAIADRLRRTGVPKPVHSARALLRDGRQRTARLAAEREQRGIIAGLDRPVLDVEHQQGGIDLGALYAIADTVGPFLDAQEWR